MTQNHLGENDGRIRTLEPFFQSCLSCGPDHFLHITSCVDKVCPNATFLSDVTECRHCPHACSVCASNKSCLRCHNGYFLSVSGQCLTRCPAGQRPDPEGRCRPCPANCKACVAGSTEMDFCTECNGEKILVNGSCVETCPDEFYRDQDRCRHCHGSCRSCTGPDLSDCRSCHPGWALNGSCLPCTPGQFYDPPSGTCQNCFRDCSSCSGPLINDCLSCRSPFLVRPGYRDA